MNLEKARSIKSKIRKGEVCIGSWMQISHPSIGEILAKAGYEWIAVDREHGAFSTEDLPNIFRAIELHGSQPFVRLAEGKRTEIKAALDSGATGIIIPMVESASQVREIIKEIHYPGKGIRGVGFSRANLYGHNFENYYATINESLTIVAQIEHINAIRNLDEILKVGELDALMIGPYDLSASMGIAGQFDKPEFISALNEFREKCQKAKKTMGFHVVKPDIELMRSKINDGYKFMAYSLDGTFLNFASDFKTALGDIK